jgi:hypothetical protein
VRSVKYEDVYLHAYASGSEARRSLRQYFAFYNGRRVHESLGYATPEEVYFGALSASTRAAPEDPNVTSQNSTRTFSIGLFPAEWSRLPGREQLTADERDRLVERGAARTDVTHRGVLVPNRHAAEEDEIVRG